MKGGIMNKVVAAFCAVMMFVAASLLPTSADAKEKAAQKATSKVKMGGRLAEGEAKGPLIIDGNTIEMTNAYAFVDQEDERKPVLLLITGKAVPAEQWKSEFDFAAYRRERPFVYVCFWLDKDRRDFRTEHFTERFPTASMGVFKLKLDPSAPNTFSGTVTKGGNQVYFIAVLKR
jgi:hypothetical protein